MSGFMIRSMLLVDGRVCGSYYHAKILSAPFEAAVQRTTDALKEQGLGVITEIDVKETLKKKIDVDFRPYRILGACNPALAYEALKLEDKVGTMLPCNVIIQEVEHGQIELAAIDPVASMQAIANGELLEKAQAVREKLNAAMLPRAIGRRAGGTRRAGLRCRIERLLAFAGDRARVRAQRCHSAGRSEQQLLIPKRLFTLRASGSSASMRPLTAWWSGRWLN